MVRCVLGDAFVNMAEARVGRGGLFVAWHHNYRRHNYLMDWSLFDVLAVYHRHKAYNQLAFSEALKVQPRDGTLCPS